MYSKELSYTWKEFVMDCLSIKKKKYDVDAVVAITNGGYYPGAFMAARYGLPLHTISASSYKDKKKSKLLVGKVPSTLAGKRVLLVDDIIDTGSTMRGVTSKLYESNIDVCDIVVVFKRYGTNYQGDSLKRVKKGVWVKFPWEEKQYEVSAV